MGDILPEVFLDAVKEILRRGAGAAQAGKNQHPPQRVGQDWLSRL
jgi:hypothetical protein